MSSSTKVLQLKNSDSKVVIDESPARHHTQLRSRISALRYRRLFEAARDGILILDAVTLKITDVNPFMTELLGYSHAARAASIVDPVNEGASIRRRQSSCKPAARLNENASSAIEA